MKKGHQRKLLPEIVSVYITTIILLKTYYYYLDMLRSKSTFKLFLSYIFRNFLQIRIKTTLIKKDWSLCDQNLQFVAILHKKLKKFRFHFFELWFFFLPNFFHCNILLDQGFPAISNLSNIFIKCSKISMTNKIVPWIKSCTLVFVFFI